MLAGITLTATQRKDGASVGDNLDTQFKAAVMMMNKDSIKSPRAGKSAKEWDGSFSRSEQLLRERARELEEEEFIKQATRILCNG